MTNTAVAVFGFRRPSHLLRTLRALQVQLRQIPLPVHLFLDGPRTGHDEAEVQACRNIAELFATVIDLKLHSSAVNLGLYRSVTSGVSEVLQGHSSVIVLEDDILTSPFFLRYMLDGLECYACEPRVASIHAYTPPISVELPETFFIRGADCWGWATWRDRWSLFRSDAAVMAAEIRDRELAAEFNLGGRVPNLELLDARAAGNSGSWAICWHASCFLADRFTLHPGRSLVKNIGLDSSGEHCAPSPELTANLADRPVSVQHLHVDESPHIVDLYSRQLSRLPLHRRFIRRLEPMRRRYRRALACAIRRVWPARLPMSGVFKTYHDALSHSGGYDADEICNKVDAAVRTVLQGVAGYERDGVVLDNRPPSVTLFDLLSQYLRPSDTVVDVGGGLGGLYVNAPELFSSSSRYLVLEQPAMVIAGRRIAHEYDLPIQFFDAENDPLPSADILILSSVLQYLPDPWNTLSNLLKSCAPRLVIVDRTAVRLGSSRWSVQTNPGYYDRSVTYPIQILDRSRLMNSFSGYRLEREWHNSFDAQRPEHVGLLFVRKGRSA